MLEVPPFTAAEGAALLAVGAGWLGEDERRELVAAVDGHALAVGVLAGLLAARPSASDLAALHAELAEAARTSTRVRRVLQFYADRLIEPHRYLLAAVCLFARPVPAQAVLVSPVHRREAGPERAVGMAIPWLVPVMRAGQCDVGECVAVRAWCGARTPAVHLERACAGFDSAQRAGQRGHAQVAADGGADAGLCLGGGEGEVGRQRSASRKPQLLLTGVSRQAP